MTARIQLLIICVLLLMLGVLQYPKAQVASDVQAWPTVNNAVVIATGNTFQTVLAAIPIGSAARRSLTIQNSATGTSTTDSCWLYLGLLANATRATGIILAPGQSYTRFFPFVPSDAVNVTCTSTGDTVYVDSQ